MVGEFPRVVAVGVCLLGAGPTGVFPLGFGGQSISVGGEVASPGLRVVARPQPFGRRPPIAEHDRLAPSHALDRILRPHAPRRIRAHDLLVERLRHFMLVDVKGGNRDLADRRGIDRGLAAHREFPGGNQHHDNSAGRRVISPADEPRRFRRTPPASSAPGRSPERSANRCSPPEPPTRRRNTSPAAPTVLPTRCTRARHGLPGSDLGSSVGAAPTRSACGALDGLADHLLGQTHVFGRLHAEPGRFFRMRITRMLMSRHKSSWLPATERHWPPSLP